MCIQLGESFAWHIGALHAGVELFSYLSWAIPLDKRTILIPSPATAAMGHFTFLGGETTAVSKVCFA
jgi:hypothetical protein